ALLAPSKDIGFHLGPAFAGVLGQLGATLPAAVIVMAVSIAELAAGLVIARFARRLPFESVSEAILAAAVATVLKDLAELSVLGQVGQFRWSLLVFVDIALLVGAWQRPGRFRPMLAAPWRPSLAGLGSLPLAVLVGVVWAGPILVQLA